MHKSLIAALLLTTLAFAGCSTTKSPDVKTSARGDSSAAVRIGIITTYDATGQHVVDVCGTAEAPCEESTSVGGAGSDGAWQTAWETIKMIAIVAGFVFGK